MSKTEAMAMLAALVVAFATLSVPAFADSNAAGPAQGSSQWVNMAGQASVNLTSALPFLSATFNSNSSTSINATVVATLHNTIGQTVALYTIPLVGVNPGQNVTVGFFVTAPFGAYTVDIFVLSNSWTAISAVTNSTIVA